MTEVPPDKLNELSQSLLWPMNLLAANCGRSLPPFTPLLEQQIPEPFRTLLAHHHNMTPTLEDYYGDTIHIERLSVLPQGNERSREVALKLDTNEQVVEYGASRIFVHALPQPAVELVQAEKVPLGTILHRCDCQHTVELFGFFKIPSIPFFQTVFPGLNGSPLYGRRNALVARDGTPLAEVCEILPPLSDKPDLGVSAEINTVGDTHESK
jgi:chorismate-pyruvate lyase